MLHLWFRNHPGKLPCYPQCCHSDPGQSPCFANFTSASVVSTTRATYGYIEIRARPMASAGSSSFWFTGGGTEIDVFELGGGSALGSPMGKGPMNRSYNMDVEVFPSGLITQGVPGSHGTPSHPLDDLQGPLKTQYDPLKPF
jgi:hypothetical protein